MGRTLLKILVFLFAFVFLCVAPPLGAALFYFLAYTLYFYRKDSR